MRFVDEKCHIDLLYIGVKNSAGGNKRWKVCKQKKSEPPDDSGSPLFGSL